MSGYMLKTKRLGLRLLSKSDIDNLVALNSDPEVRQFFPDGTQNREQTTLRLNEFLLYYKEQGLPCFGMFELETGEFVGRAGFGPVETGEVEVGYILHKKFWGKGYASEVLEALLEWARAHLQVDYIIAFAPVAHRASQRVMQKCGMEYYKNGIAKEVECCFYRIKNS